MNPFRASRKYANRLDLARLLTDKGLTGHGAEVGVWRGDFAHPFLARWPGTLHLVDAWTKLPGYVDVRADDDHDANYKFTRYRMREYGPRCVIHRTTSQEVPEVPDGLHFVYIDADHSYEQCLADLYFWWNKVAPGGVLAGHDLFSMTHPGVTAAVVEFCRTAGLPAEVVDGDYNTNGMLCNAHSLYVEKPGSNP